MQKKRSCPRSRVVCMTHESRLPQSWHLSVEFAAVSDGDEVDVTEVEVGVGVDDGRFIVTGLRFGEKN